MLLLFLIEIVYDMVNSIVDKHKINMVNSIADKHKILSINILHYGGKIQPYYY
jgi:hypothetical protein